MTAADNGLFVADKAFDADRRVIKPVAAAGKTAVIPPTANRTSGRGYDRELYKARPLVENFFAKLSSFEPSRPATTRPRAISSPPSTSPPASFGSI